MQLQRNEVFYINLHYTSKSSEDVQSMYKPSLFSSKLTGRTKPNATSFLDKIQFFFCVAFFFVICFTLSLASSFGFPSLSCLSRCLSFISLQYFSLQLQLPLNLEAHTGARNLSTFLKYVLIKYVTVCSSAVFSKKEKGLLRASFLPLDIRWSIHK